MVASSAKKHLSAIDWAQSYQMQIVYIQHNNISAGTRTFKPGTKGVELWRMMLTIESIWLSCLKLCMMNCQKEKRNRM